MKLTLFFIFMFAVLLFLALVMIAFFGAIIAVPIILINKSNKEKKDEAVALQINPSAAETTASGSMEGTMLDQQIDSTL